MTQRLCAWHVVTVFFCLSSVAAAHAPSECARLVEAPPLGPDLATVRIFLKPDVQKWLGRSPYRPEALGAAIRKATREPLARPQGKSEFVLFLTGADGIKPELRVDFVWIPEHGWIQVHRVRDWYRPRDHETYHLFEQRSRLRGFPIPMTALDLVLESARAQGVELREMIDAFARPLGPALDCLKHEGHKWFLGESVTDRFVSLEYSPPREPNGSNRLMAVVPASRDRKRVYYSVLGHDFERAEDQIELARGPFRFNKVKFGMGLLAKIENQHGVGRAEVVEALENSRGGIPSEALYKGSGVRKWLVTRLASGLNLKVTYVIERTGEMTILTAFHVESKKLLTYDKTVARLLR